MSNFSCNACNDLRDTSPEFIQNGVTDTICASLMNNTGLNPGLTTLHDNCEDLHNINDCLIGRMEKEVESYEVCDWKKFMANFIPNMYETYKAIICGDCGQWNNIGNLWDRYNALCALVNANIQMPSLQYGTLEGTTNYDEDRFGGRIENNSLINPDKTQPATNVGLYIATLTATNCDGVCKKHVWVKPDIHFYFLDESVSYGDPLWSVEHSKAIQWGIPEGLYDLFRRYPQYFIGYTDVFGNTSVATLGIYVDETEDRLQVRYLGCTGDMRGKKFNSTSTVNDYHYVTNC